jgi:NADH:ubiquinone oxidoreductase subunit C
MSEEAALDQGPVREVRERVREMVSSGARMITIVAREDDDGTVELIYVFDRSGKVVDFRVRVLPEWELESVADIYKGALGMEREVVDLFGLRFKGVAPGLFLEEGRSPIAPLRRKKGGVREDATHG